MHRGLDGIYVSTRGLTVRFPALRQPTKGPCKDVSMKDKEFVFSQKKPNLLSQLQC